LKGIGADDVEHRHSRTSTARLTDVVNVDTVLLMVPNLLYLVSGRIGPLPICVRLWVSVTKDGTAVG
jgi:hypothetical protein